MIKILSSALVTVVSLAVIFTARGHERITTKITFNKEIVRVLEKNCVSCHRTGGLAPMALTTYAEVRPWAKAIKEEVLERRMPPWNAVAGYREFSNDPSLSGRDLDLITAWVDGGAPKGDDKDLPTLRDFTKESSRPAPINVKEIVVSQEKFEIPPEDAAHPVKASHILRQDVEAVSVQPRMNHLGKSIEVRAVRPDGSVEILVWIREYDVDWSRTYVFKKPILLPRGTRIEVSAYYDNSSSNPQNPHQPPQVVGPPEEICAAAIAVVSRQLAARSAR